MESLTTFENLRGFFDFLGSGEISSVWLCFSFLINFQIYTTYKYARTSKR